MDQPTLSHPHDAYRRFKEDEYISLDERVAKVEETCEKRFSLARKGIFDQHEKQGNIVEKQLHEHNLELEKLNRIGDALTTNIRIACEQRQLEQRETENVCNEEMLLQIQKKSIENEERMVNIHRRWTNITSRDEGDSVKLMKMLRSLTKQMEEIMKSKDEVIQTVKSDLNRLTEGYDAVLCKQDYDLHYCMQRVNNHLSKLKQCYLRHILALDETINKHHQDEYARIYKCRHEFSSEIIVGADTSEMLDNLNMKHRKERDHKTALQSKYQELRIQHQELTHSLRMQMEQDQEAIEMELEAITAKYFLNSMKFNYVYQVLEKKNTENVNKMAYEEKKKNVFKSMNLVTDLKKEIREMKSKFDSSSQLIAADTEKIRDRILQMEVKAFNGAQANESKFQSILAMNLEEANNLIKQMFDFNAMFFEKHLGIFWQSPDLQILDHSDLETLHKNHQIKPKVSPNAIHKENKEHFSIKDIAKGTDNWKTLQMILKKMPTGMSYIIDKDLPGLLELSRRTEKEIRLAQLDNIFSALDIDNLADLSTLLTHFKLFTHCPNCGEEKIVDIHEPESETLSNSTEDVEESSFKPFVDESNSIPDNLSVDLDLITHIENLNEMQTTSDRRAKTMCPDHRLDLNSAQIISALKLTMQKLEAEKLAKAEYDEKRNTETTSSFDLEVRKSQIELLWKRYCTMFPDEYVRLWSSLEEGLADYLMHLKRRFQLHSECQHLRKQNSQLKFMLQELL